MTSAGQTLGGRYRLGAQIGAGGMGTVFEARDELLRRRVAVKLLPPEVQADRTARERLRGEALAAAALDHPFICKIHELGDADGTLFVVMEYVEGQTLHELTAHELLPVRQIIDMAIEIVEALDEAHRRDLVHRDLKPANLMLTAQGHLKVMDFGLAKQVNAPVGHDSGAQTVLTDSGTRVGTPGYMSPEQVLGAPLDARSDIFSLGVVLYELATGHHPFKRTDTVETMSAILRDPPSGGARDLEELPGLAALVRRMLAKACAERPQSMGELRGELEMLRDRARSSSSSVAPAALPGTSAERTPFVGREAESAELSAMLDRMLTGQGALALIGGEPGVGKTRLSRELLKLARQRGCVTLTGHCYEMEGAPPFVPFVEITEDAVRLVPHAVRVALGDEAPEIASIVPSLRRTYDDIPPMPDVPAEQRRRLVFNAMLAYMRRASQKSPGVLLLDDLHWADEPSLQFLAHLVPHLSSMRLLVVGTYRDVELDVGRPFARTLEGLLRQRLATRIALRRLDETGVAGMLSAIAGAPPPSGLAKAVFHETEGNPFFVEEVYHHLAEEGKLFDDSGQWKSDLRVGTVEVPEGVRLVVGRRLDRLGDQARKVLTAGAIIGRMFPLRVLLAVVDVSEDEALDALEQAEHAQLVTTDATRRAVRYEFVHELIRTTLVDALSLPRRQRLHLRIADALESTSASVESSPSVLAHHLYQAGAAVDVERTGSALDRAGRAADEAGGFEEAVGIYDNLLSLELPESNPLVAEAFERRGVALAGLQRHGEAVKSFERAMALYARRANDAGLARSARMARATVAWEVRWDEAIAILSRALEWLSTGARAERAQLDAMISVLLSASGRFDQAESHLERALALVEDLGNGPALGRVLAQAAFVAGPLGDNRAALDYSRRALTLLPEEPSWDRAHALTALINATSASGSLDETAAILGPLDEVVRRTGHPGARWTHDLMAPVVAWLRSGDQRAALSAVEPQLRSPVFRYATRSTVAILRLYLGEEDRALEEFAQVVAEQPPSHLFTGMPEGNLFAAAALVGRHDLARTVQDAVAAHLPVSGQKNVRGRYLALCAYVQGLVWLGEVERVPLLYSLTLHDIERGIRMPSGPVVGPTSPQLVAAIAAEAGGLAEKADAHFATASSEAHEIPVRNLQPAVLYWHGRAIAGRPGTGDRGRAMVEAALEDFRTLDMPPHIRLCEQFLKEGR